MAYALRQTKQKQQNPFTYFTTFLFSMFFSVFIQKNTNACQLHVRQSGAERREGGRKGRVRDSRQGSGER